MSERKDEVQAVPVADKELDDLLDSALEDMHPPVAKKKENGENTISTVPAENEAEWNPSENVWSEEFLQQAAATFESNMAALLSSIKGCPEEAISQDQIAATFQMMAEAAAQVMKPAGQADDSEDPALEDEEKQKPKETNDVSAAIAEAVQIMNANTDSLQNQNPFCDEDLKNMFSGLNLNPDDDTAGGNMFMPFMQGMMQSLLSKEVLYPSLKEMVDKYPTWLEENKSKLSPQDYERFSKQNALMSSVCSELEMETPTDSDDVKRRRFEKVLGLMQQMQELGQPPEELAGEMPQLPGPGDMIQPPMDPNQCKPM